MTTEEIKRMYGSNTKDLELLDKFAMHALSGLCAKGTLPHGVIVEHAYNLAERMLEERRKRYE